MPRIYVNFASLDEVGTGFARISSKIKTVHSDVSQIVQKLDWDVRYEADIDKKAEQILRELDNQYRVLKSYEQFIIETSRNYRELDEYKKFENQRDTQSYSFLEELWADYGWAGLLAGSPYASKILSLLNDFKNGKTWRDFGKSAAKTYQFLSGAVNTFKKYKKIGRAVGTKTAMAWWAKNITGLKPLGRASSAKKLTTRFYRNLTNKTSPFNAQFKDIINDFKGSNGIGKAVTSWGAVATTGIFNYLDNKDEQAASNGSMSDGRVILETVTETAIDTALTYGSGIVIGAAATAVFGSVAVPGILVVGTTALVTSAINVGVKAVTGTTVTEFLSDGLLNLGENIGRNMSSGKVFNNWMGILSF